MNVGPSSPTRCNPRATKAQTIVRGRARFTVLADRLIRMEYAADEVFEDRATLTVCNRRTRRVRFRVEEHDDGLVIDTGALRLVYRDDGRRFYRHNLTATFTCAGDEHTWHPGLRDRGNLGGTLRTLDGMDGDRKEVHDQAGTRRWRRKKVDPGLLSRDGWAVVDDSHTVVLDPHHCQDDRSWPVPRPSGHRQDLYLLAYGHDYQAALRDAAAIFGQQPLPPRYALGYWYSKYWAYTDREIEELVAQFDRMDVPLDVMVIDMDWHKIGWTGYSWCRSYFPDPAAHLRWLKERDLKIALNLHPAGGVGEHEDMFADMVAALGEDKVHELVGRHGLRQDIKEKYLHLYGKTADNYRHVPFDITDPDYMQAYFEVLHRPQEADGVDLWWMDWQQGESSAIPGLDTLPWINQLHWEDQERNPARAGQRPLNFSRYGGLGAGRYPVGFSGDTHVTWRSLAYQPRFTATAGNVLYGYWSHDIGGHIGGPTTPELYTRWMQFGLYSPILRTHACKIRDSERRVFEYPDPYKYIMMDCIRARYALVPYIYTQLRRCVDSGLSLVRPMYYRWPDNDEAYAAEDQYQFGDDLIVAPVTRPVDAGDDMAPVTCWLPPGRWFDTAHGILLDGGQHHTRRYLIDEIPVFARAGAIIPGQQVVRRLAPGSYPDLVFTAYPGADGRAELYEDDGVSTAYLTGTAAVIPVRQRQTAKGCRLYIGKAKGDFDGFVARRSVEIRLPGSPPPARVTVDGTPLPWYLHADSDAYTWDGDTATTIIRIARIDLQRGCRIAVDHDPALSPDLLAGLAGRMRRLIRIGREVARVSPPRTLFADERHAPHLGQTGNRMTRWPHTAAEELRALDHALPQLPAHLATYLRIYRRDRRGDKDDGIASLQYARRLALSTLRQR